MAGKIEIGQNIKKYRELSGLTQLELAQKLGVTDRCVSSWEMNRTQPKMGHVEMMSNILNCSKSQLLGWSNPAPVPIYDPITMEIISILPRLTQEQKQSVMQLLRSMVK